MCVSAGLEVEDALLSHGLVVAATAQTPKVPGWRHGRLCIDYIAFLRRTGESVERSVAQTTNQKDRQLQLKGRRLADMFEAIAGHH